MHVILSVAFGDTATDLKLLYNATGDASVLPPAWAPLTVDDSTNQATGFSAQAACGNSRRSQARAIERKSKPPSDDGCRATALKI
jgi:hypothetical protein